MQAHAALRAIRKALAGHQAGPGPKRTPAQSRAALARAEALIEKLRELASPDELDTVTDEDRPSPYESALELQHRVRVRATVEATKAKLRAALKLDR